MSTKPTDDARWAQTVGGVVTSNYTSPSSGQKDTGWVVGQSPPSSYFNWWMNSVHLWLQWLDDGDVSFNDVTVGGTLGVTGATTFTGVTNFVGPLEVTGTAPTLTVGSQLLSFADFTFTADAGTDLLTKVAHGLETGDGPVRVANSGGGLPGGLAPTTNYWVIRVDADTFKLAVSRAKAWKDIPIDITSNGTGTQTLSDQDGTTRAGPLTTTAGDMIFGGSLIGGVDSVIENIDTVSAIAGDFDTLAVSGATTLSGGLTVPTGQTVALDGTTTLVVGGDVTFSGTLDVTGAAVFDDNVTLGNAAGDTLTVNATTSLVGPTTFNGNATVATGKTLTMTDGASSLKGMTTTTTTGIDLAECLIVAGSAASQASPVGIVIPASTTYRYKLRIPPRSHETVTSLSVVFISTAHANNVASIAFKYIDHGFSLTTITGISFTQSGQSWAMSGSPSVTLDGPAGRVYFLEVTTSGSGSANWYALEMTSTT